MEEQTKYKIISLIEAGHEAKEISEDLGQSYSAVLRIRRELKEAKLNGTIDTLVNVDKLVLQQAADNLDLPEANIEKVTKGLQGLDVLNDAFQKTALNINTRVNSLIMSAEHASELQTYTDILCALQSSFINKNMTQVNVQNNFGDQGSAGSRYSQYLSDVPGA